MMDDTCFGSFPTGQLVLETEDLEKMDAYRQNHAQQAAERAGPQAGPRYDEPLRRMAENLQSLDAETKRTKIAVDYLAEAYNSLTHTSEEATA